MQLGPGVTKVATDREQTDLCRHPAKSDDSWFYHTINAAHWSIKSGQLRAILWINERDP